MKIVVLLSRFPYPLEKGDKLRAFHQIKELSKNHDIYLCALTDVFVSDESVQKVAKYCAEIEVVRLRKWEIVVSLIKELFLGDKPLQVAYFYNCRAQKKVSEFIEKHQPNHIYCQLIRVAEYVRKLSVKKTLDYMDALARGTEKRVEVAPFYLKWIWKIETTRLKRYEHFILADFDHQVIISKQDRDLIVNIKQDEIVVVPNGVDYDTYKRTASIKKYDLIFTGNMAYPPNVDSVLYLVEQVMPLVWKENKEVNLVIVGADPSKKVLKLQSEKISVTGWVDDISAYYASSKLFIAPMQLGSGLQNKLLEAMAMQLPCVTSQLANNALGAIPQKSILIGTTPKEYAQHVLHLLVDEKEAQNIAVAGHQFVTENYTWEGSTLILEKVITSSS